nr:NAD(P)-binding domain-containing protein [Spiroplasma clarkii]
MIGLIGLGKMGLNLIKNMAKQQLDPVGFDIDQKTYPKLTQANIKTASSLVRLIEILPKPRTVMLLLPSGAITQNCFEELLTLLEPGDVIIDAGNSHYQDSIKRYQAAQTKKIDFMDCGTSGGQSGALNGACLMVGGDLKVVQKYEEIFKNLQLPMVICILVQQEVDIIVKWFIMELSMEWCKQLQKGMNYYKTQNLILI